MARRKKDAAHDVLAAEEFGVPAPDPRLRVEPVRDVLAAEEFGVPGPDPKLTSEPPHDVLAADEFPVPAPSDVAEPAAARDWPPRVAIAVAGLLLVGAAGAKLRRRR